MQTLTVRAYAKLNLFLDITGRRADGYHELKTVMQSIGLYDELTFTLSEGTGIELSCTRADLPLNEDNLIHKGIMAVLHYAGFQPGCRITAELTKRIPSGAGMGGGSADCAAAIIAMDRLFNLGMSTEELCTAGKMCGADVPFCIVGGTALCEGIGEKMTPLPAPKDVIFAVAKPMQSISTPEAYRLFDTKGTPAAGDYDGFAAALADGTPGKLGGALYNAFTAADEQDYIRRIKMLLKKGGAYGSEMTGSGSAVFGVFSAENETQAELALGGIVPEGFTAVCRPVPHGVEIVEPGKSEGTPNDWRLLTDTENLREKYLDPASTDDMRSHLPQLTRCALCFDRVEDEPEHSRRIWYVTPERDCTVCEKCFADLHDRLCMRSTDGYDTEWQ